MNTDNTTPLPEDLKALYKAAPTLSLEDLAYLEKEAGSKWAPPRTAKVARRGTKGAFGKSRSAFRTLKKNRLI